jgi:predicted amidohydrolase YtcJ
MRSNTRLTLAALLLAGGVCSAASAEQADIVFKNGKIFTVDQNSSIKSAMAVRGDKIIAIGGDEILSKYTAPRVIELNRRLVLPGFIETHVHIDPVAQRQVSMENLTSIKMLQDRIRAKAKELGPGEWITGEGWDEALFEEKRVPLRADLDAAAPNNPVVITRAGGHSNVSNSLALKLGKIDRNTPDPPGAVIEKGPDGEPNGVVREQYMLYSHLIPRETYEAVRQSYIDGFRRLLSFGITSFHEASSSIDDEPVGSGGIPDVGPQLTYRRVKEIYAQNPDLPRTTLYITYPGPVRLKAFPYRSGDGDTRVRLGGIGENPVDGGFTGPAALLSVDYKGMPGFRGKAQYSEAELQAMTDDAARNGWQMALHAIGDVAIEQTVRAYSKSLNTIQGPGRQGTDRRWFLDHFTIMPSHETMTVMARDGIMAAAQPNFLYNLEARYRAWLQGDMLAHNNPVKTPQKLGVRVAFGSDNLPIGPMVGIYAAVTRKGPSGQAMGFAEEAVSREDAIRMYTHNGAFLSWEEAIKGSLEPGKLADIIVLEKDILTIPEEQILKTRVDMTFVGGNLVYERK